MTKEIDRAITVFDRFLRTMTQAPSATRSMPDCPGDGGSDEHLTDDERRHAAGLMRVNDVGEICAQALYQAQALTAADATVRQHFEEAAEDEASHLAWTGERLRQLHSRPSLLRPLWYAGSFAMGLAAGRAGRAKSLGFVVETERQVEEHLAGHLERLPIKDQISRVIVEQMRVDEIRHGREAEILGATELPWSARMAMRVLAKVMTTTAYWI